MQVDLDGKVALVTGEAQGIGRAIVQQLAITAPVCIVDVDEGARQAAQEVGGHAWQGDVVDVEGMRLVVDEIVSAPGAEYCDQQCRHKYGPGARADSQLTLRVIASSRSI